MNPHIASLQADLGLRIDGIRGPVTTAEVLQAADNGRLMVKPLADEPAAPMMPVHPAKWPARADLESFFGPAGSPDCTAGSAVLPFPFVIAWDSTQRIVRHSCHRLVAPSLTRIYAEAAKHYGEEQFRLLRLDQWGGCYNFRATRGGTRLSTHAWGIAVDIDPERNGLTMGRDKATLDGAIYDDWWKIVEAEGAVSLGRKIGRDFMHFQFCGL